MAKSYRVGVVGESNYQRAIAGLREGEVVHLRPEPNNPHDPRAIAVVDGDGDTIGYVPRDHWLTDAIVDQGKSARAVVLDLNKGPKGTGVVIDVTLGNGQDAAPPPGAQRRMTPAERRADDNRKAGIGCLVVVGLLTLAVMCSDPAEDAAPEIVEKAEPVAVKAWHSAIIAAARPCDRASADLRERVAAADAQGTTVDAYRAALAAKEACRASRDALDGVKVPPLTAAAAPKAKEAMETCSNALSARYLTADRAAEIIDGDTSASTVSEFADFSDRANKGTVLCAAQALGAATLAGVPVGDLTPVAGGSAEE